MRLFKNTMAATTALLLSIAGSTVFAQSGSELDLFGAGEFENSQDNRGPRNVIDGSTNSESRWSSRGEPRNVWVDLGSVQRVTDVAVAWGFGDDKVYDFEIRAHTSLSGSWDRVFRGESRGNTNNFEVYNVDNVDARYIRVKVHENDFNGWQSITEIKVYGEGDDNDSDDNREEDDDREEDDNRDDDDGGNNDSNGSGDFGLDPRDEPWENFDLSDWAIDTVARASDGDSERYGERDWEDGSSDSDRYFFTHSDGGMRFVTRLDGARTSSGTSFVRTLSLIHI